MRISRLIAGLFIAGSSIAAFAAPVVSGSVSNVDLVANGQYVAEDRNGQTGATTASSTYSSGGRTLEASAQASLEKAQLSAYAQYSAGVLPGSVGATYFAAYGDATIQDTFIHSATNSNPFIWSSGNTATFSLDISGSSSIIDSRGQAVPDTFGLFATGLVIFQAYDLSGNLIFDYAIGLTQQSNFYLSWLTGFTAVDKIATGSSETFEFSFNPGQDFSWSIWLSTSAGSMDALPGLTATADYSHTVHVDYTAPEGSTYESTSGLFRAGLVNTVPEPTSLALVGVALAGLALSRRRKQ